MAAAMENPGSTRHLSVYTANDWRDARLKKLSWLVAVLLFVGAPKTSFAQETQAPKARRKAPAKTAPAPAPAPAPEPPAQPASPSPQAPAPAPAPAPAAPEPATPPEAPVEESLGIQKLGDFDMRLHVDSDILLAFVELGVGADFGLIPAGPGTLALGAELSGGICLTACGLIGLVTGISVSDRFISPHARLTYHFLPPNQKLEGVDIYGLLLAGVTVSNQKVSGRFENVDFNFTGTGVGPSLGLGLGAKKFVKDRIFIGGEARLRYARGDYSYSEQVENITVIGVDPDWSQTGLSLLFFVGLRV